MPRFISFSTFTCFATLACALTQPVHAQDNGDPLEEIVVSATRLQTTVRDVDRAISVIDRQTIQEGTQQLGLDEALARVPGLYLQNRYNFAQDLRISLRGFGARSAFGVRGVKLVVDGIPETLPDGQAQVDSVDLGSAERIEVLRGPASSLYGNASGGVIAIETESGDEARTELYAAAGELGFNRLGMKQSGKLGSANYLFNLARQEIDGYREHSAARGALLNSRIDLPLGGDEDRLRIALSLSDQPESRDPGGINAAQAAAAPRSARDRNIQFDAGEALDQQRLGLVYTRERDGGELQLRNYYTWRDFAGKLPFTNGGIVEFDRFVTGAGLQYRPTGALPESLQLALGIDADRQDDSRRRFNNLDGRYGDLSLSQNEQVTSLAAYAQARWQLDERWAVSAGIRRDAVEFRVDDRFLDDGDDSGQVDFSQWSPSLGLSYALPQGTLFVNWSSSFETPTTTELANPDGSGGFNTGLEPQQADNLELGVRLGNEQGFAELVVFDIRLNDELVPFELAQFPGRTFYANAGRSERNGVEVAAGWQLREGVRLDASWTWSDFRYREFIDEDGNDFGGRRLPGIPRQHGYLGLALDLPVGRAVIEAVHAGELFADDDNGTEVPAYTVANLRWSAEHDAGRVTWRPYIGINNLFDERYNSNIRINAFGGRYFEPAPGRNLYAGISLSWGRNSR